MRTNPIGTGPVQVRGDERGQSVKLVRNPDYWKKGKPYLDAIEWKVIENRSTRILAFVAGEFDMTFPTDVTIPLLKDVTSQAPKAVCELAPHVRIDQSDRQSRGRAVQRPEDPQGDGARPRSQSLRRHPEWRKGRHQRGDVAAAGGRMGHAAGGAQDAAGIFGGRREQPSEARKSWRS